MRRRDSRKALTSAQRVETVEAERRAFLRQHFHAEFDDPIRLGLVVNTAILGPDAAVATVAAAFTARASVSGGGRESASSLA
jgi:hypothetical protein